jgi:hypothetical protein
MYHTITHQATGNGSHIRAEQVIEQVAEPLLEHLDLGFRARRQSR